MKRVWGVLALGLLWLQPFCACAAEEGEPHRLSTVTVTAEKVEQDLQKVPGSVDAMSDVVLEERKIEDLLGVIDYVPNVTVQKNSVENIVTIRGISPFGTSIYSPTGFYVDGINYPIHQMQNIDLIDVERVEVLKGPQGTLYGRNSEAGVINVITKQPGNTFEGKIFFDTGLWDDKGTWQLTTGGSLNLPLVEDVLAVRAALQYKNSDGWMENIEGSPEDAAYDEPFNGRVSARWTPTPDWEILFQLEGEQSESGLGVYRYLTGPNKTDQNELAWNGANKNEVDSNGQVLKVVYSGLPFTITSVTGRHDYDQEMVQDMDMGPTDAYGSAFRNAKGTYEVEVLSEEFRLSSNPGVNEYFDWVAGVYAYAEDATITTSSSDQETDHDNWGAALFAQGTVHFFDRLHLTLGGRVDHTALEAEKTGMNGFTEFSISDELTNTEFLPSASLAFDITPQIMTYIKASNGYLAGGFDNYFSKTEETFTYDPEYSWNYEAGVKGKFLEDRLMVNLAAFYIDITDKQVIEFLSPYERRVRNAAKAESRGVELDVRYMPIPQLTLFASGGYMDSKIKDWETTGYENYDYSDKTVPGAPEFTYAFGGTYRWESGFVAGADVTGTSSYYTDAKNELEISERALVNLRLGYETESYDIVFWAKNILNNEYCENKWDWGGGSIVAQQGEPRALGVTLTYRF